MNWTTRLLVVLGFTLAAVVIHGALLALVPRGARIDRAEAIKPGMSRGDVEAILGGSPDTVVKGPPGQPGCRAAWVGEYGQVVVAFDGDGTVLCWSGDVVPTPTLLEAICRRLRG